MMQPKALAFATCFKLRRFAKLLEREKEIEREGKGVEDFRFTCLYGFRVISWVLIFLFFVKQRIYYIL